MCTALDAVMRPKGPPSAAGAGWLMSHTCATFAEASRLHGSHHVDPAEQGDPCAAPVQEHFHYHNGNLK